MWFIQRLHTTHQASDFCINSASLSRTGNFNPAEELRASPAPTDPAPLKANQYLLWASAALSHGLGNPGRVRATYGTPQIKNKSKCLMSIGVNLPCRGPCFCWTNLKKNLYIEKHEKSLILFHT